LARESNVVRLISELPNRKMEADFTRDGEQPRKVEPEGSYQKGVQ